MGSIKLDISKNEREWDIVNESTIESIKGLLKYRYQFDPLKSIDDAYIKTGEEEYKINYQAVHIYVDLERHVESAKLTKDQKEILNLYQTEKTESQIAKILNKTTSTINGILNTICQKIYNEALEEWKSYINLSIIKTQYNYKQCTKCDEFKPIHNDYFSPDSRNKDKFRGICKKCDNYTKKTE